MKIYALSDQHAMLDTEVPECDLLIVAGDQCPDGIGGVYARTDPRQQLHWWKREWLPWRDRQPAQHCLVTWGNHDYCGMVLERDPYEREVNGRTTEVVVDRLVEYGGLKIWLSPWSKEFCGWAFMMPEDDLRDHLLINVPPDIDIFVTHDPPHGYGDIALDYTTGKIAHYGSKAVLETVERVKPRVVICGHFHDGFGVYNMDICEKHGSQGHGCECLTFRSTTIYNVAQAGGAASKGNLYLPQSRGAVEIIL